jgi:type II secretory pathway pseudopilin PulG
MKLINRQGSVVLGLIIAVIVTALVAGGLTYSLQKKQGDDKVKEVEKVAQEAQNKASDLEQKLADEQKKLEEVSMPDKNPTQEWVNYTSTNYNLSFFYPKGWSINDSVANSEQPRGYVGIGLTPPTMSGDIQWGIQVYKSSETTIDKLINAMGDQFTDRQVQKEKINIAGVSATKAIVTTATIPEWYYESIIISKDSKIYQISNGAVKDEKFSTFYNSIVIK